MFNLQQMQEIANTKNVIFGKDSCRFCSSALILINRLVELKILNNFVYYHQGQEFDDAELKQLLLNNNWQPDGFPAHPTKPQIFIQGQYIGGNFEFYKSQWNVGENMPNLVNPMRF
jgi:glutaredoxin